MNANDDEAREVLKEELIHTATQFINLASDANCMRVAQILQENDCREILVNARSREILSDAFVRAAFCKHIFLLRLFLDNGIDVDIQCSRGETALMCAAQTGYVDSVALLLTRNAKVDLQSEIGYTALIRASLGRTMIVKLLLENNANPDIQSNNGMTALMLASQFAYHDIVQLLLDHGADVGLVNKEGKSALSYASSKKIKEIFDNHVDTGYILK